MEALAFFVLYMWILIIIGIIIFGILLWNIGTELRAIRYILTSKIWDDHTKSKEYKEKYSWKGIAKRIFKHET